MIGSVCFSYNFLNKQNARSFNNVFCLKILKTENHEKFLYNIFQEDYSVSKLPQIIQEILSCLRINIKNNCGDDFKNFLNNKTSGKSLEVVDKKLILNGSILFMLKIMPKLFFGNNHNIKIFKSCIRRIIYSMRKEHIFFGKLLETWDFTADMWKNLGVAESESQYILETILMWVFRNILSAFICLNFYVTTCKVDSDENKLHYFWISEWQRFYDKEISTMRINNIITKYEPYCLGKKVKIKYILQERVDIKHISKEIPKLHLVLKSNNDFRPIVRYKNGAINNTEKYKIKERLAFLRILHGKQNEKLETQFAALHSCWVKNNKPKLYFVKTDLSNAFGSINKALLQKIVSEKFSLIQKSDLYPLHVKNKFALQYKEMMEELKKPLLIRAGSTVYEWKAGLVQGYKYSPALSELYYSYMDKLIFSEHMNISNNQLKLFVRVVDDYLYITDNIDDAHSFLKSLSKYKNVNYSKTAVNFEYPDIKMCEEISFLGYTYNTNSLNVNRSSNIYTGQMCYKITFSSAIEDTENFIENRIGQSGIPLNDHIFNLKYNDEETIWRIIFTSFCVSANKFCTILSILCNERDMLIYLTLYKKKITVKLCNTMIEVLLRNKPNDYLFVYCINHFRYLSFKALLLCAKKTAKCSPLIPYIDVELSKSNCIFGKWREHACRIKSSGEIGRSAVKIVCRRPDLRKIMKTFDDLPAGFQCYKNIFV
ncbi:telomerase reverse transcriptase-like [Colias croceus]|uniref:telomerase reverse transcriptase-like n=1 Tax=Colias crocea TaxID=72248 RepID=UPI001E27B3B9|nr:telomerase reverse transcriptase-like [Colias croceus]